MTARAPWDETQPKDGNHTKEIAIHAMIERAMAQIAQVWRAGSISSSKTSNRLVTARNMVSSDASVAHSGLLREAEFHL